MGKSAPPSRGGRLPGLRTRRSALEPVHGGALEFTVGLAAFEVFALIVLGFAFAYCERHFHLPVLPIEGKWDEGIAFDFGESGQFTNLAFVQKQLARGFGLMVLQVPVRIFINVSVKELHFSVLDPGKSVTKLSFAGAEGLNLGALQHDSSLEGLKDVIIPAGFRIAENIGHNIQPAKDNRARLERPRAGAQCR